MATYFTVHAFERVEGRLSLSIDELVPILNYGFYINIGEEPKTNRVHKLFYSKIDEMCFVVIQDNVTGYVITILPIDYHENISWKVSIGSQLEAKYLIVGKDETPVEPLITSEVNIPLFKISGYIVDEFKNYYKSINLSSWPSEPYACSIDLLIKDDDFVEALNTRIQEKLSIFESSSLFLETIVIRLGNKGDPASFSKSDIFGIRY
jgi:hypothetical protein